MDEGLLAFKVASVNISTFAGQALNYDVENETGTNPVWVRIRLTDSNQTEYQFVPASYGYANGWHTINAAAGQWQLMDNDGNAIGNPMTLDGVAAANPGVAVDRVYLTLGMGDSYNVSPGVGTVGWIDKVTIGGVTYDFVIANSSTTISGNLSTSVSITVPSTFTFTAFKAGWNVTNWGAGSCTVTVTTGGMPGTSAWAVTATGSKQMVGPSSALLTDEFLISPVSGTWSCADGTSSGSIHGASYSGQYNATGSGSGSFDMYAAQYIEPGDITAGNYTDIITFTASISL